MVRLFLLIGSMLGGLAVAAGAFASHALKDKLTDRSLEIFELATRYQMYHALALLLIALLLSRAEAAPPLLSASGAAFIAGVLIFCGSLYALSFTGIKGLGAITPIGGVAFLAGWICLAIAAWGYK
ncbi:DUF423 domain-containing protein [Thermocoleostomius sinensis]|uniref:DUF423 domain-containing protein n=1 Tax=Thermocoleostomius sinensis A174 TaxID=2016057 RepID=A0A9E8ZD66_9CYAN|nr:DUF423 domain-containing protein [Thermocoleostomius sinensis]WAL61119.1 DUF423 domain-containing protein [Thermocoleostomius sinensis A174]